MALYSHTLITSCRPDFANWECWRHLADLF